MRGEASISIRISSRGEGVRGAGLWRDRDVRGWRCGCERAEGPPGHRGRAINVSVAGKVAATEATEGGMDGDEGYRRYDVINYLCPFFNLSPEVRGLSLIVRGRIL